VSKDHSYLGMQIKVGEGQVTVDMSYYLNKILREFKGLKPETLPGEKNLFLSNAESPLLSKLERHSFHTVVAKLMYLSRRARIDIITSVSILCTWVQALTNEVQTKLKCLLGYLCKTKNTILHTRERMPELAPRIFTEKVVTVVSLIETNCINSLHSS